MGEALLSSRKGSGSNGSGSEAIGDIKYTCKTDLGDEWVPCDGRFVYGKEIYNILKHSLRELDIPIIGSAANRAYMGYGNGIYYVPYTAQESSNVGSVGIYTTSTPENPDSWEYTDLTSELYHTSSSYLARILSISFLNDKFILVVNDYTTTETNNVGFTIYESESIKGPYTKKGVIGSTNYSSAWKYSFLRTNLDIIYKDSYYYVLLARSVSNSTPTLQMARSQDLATWEVIQIYTQVSSSTSWAFQSCAIFKYSEVLGKFVILIGAASAGGTTSYITATNPVGTWSGRNNCNMVTDYLFDIQDFNDKCIISADGGTIDIVTRTKISDFGGKLYPLNDGLYLFPYTDKKIHRINEDGTIDELADLGGFATSSADMNSYNRGVSNGSNIFVMFEKSTTIDGSNNYKKYSVFDNSGKRIPIIPSIDTEQAYIKVE